MALLKLASAHPNQESPGQRLFCCPASRVLSVMHQVILFLEDYPFFGGPVPKIGHWDIVSSAIGIARVSMTFFLSYLPLSMCLACLSQWPVSKAWFCSLQRSCFFSY